MHCCINWSNYFKKQFSYINKFECEADLQDGRGVRCGDHLLNTGRRLQTSQKARNSPRTWLGQKNKRKNRQKNRDRTCTSRREL